MRRSKRMVVSLVAIATVATLLGGVMIAKPVSAQSASGGGFWSNLWSSLHHTPVPTPTPTPVLTPPLPTAAPAPTSLPKSQASYVALGDSVAAGFGLPSLPAPSATDTACGRSAGSYAYTVAKTMNLSLTPVACSGATIGDLFTKQAVSGPNITAQLQTAYSAGTPKLITITAGANDAHWADFIRGCYAASCANSATTLLANGYLKALQAKLYVGLADINIRSAVAPPTTVITGYYNPLSAACTRYQTGITTDEINWLTAETNALNQTIKQVSSHFAFVRFAALDFSGHDMCASTPWVQGAAAAAPFHPNAAGQQVIAGSVLRSLGY